MTAWMKDRADVALAMGDDLEKAVVKATNREEVTPKEKHVKRLIGVSFGPKENMVKSIRLLVIRLEESSWVVRIKTLVVFHRIFLEGDNRFIAKLSRHSGVLSQEDFMDNSTPQAIQQSQFVREYSRYLEEKVTAYGAIGEQHEKARPNNARETGLRHLDEESVLYQVPILQTQLDVLMEIKPGRRFNNAPIIAAFTLLMKDAFRLFHALNDAIINIIERFFDMRRSRAEAALRIYKRFTDQIESMRRLLDRARSVPNLNCSFPDLKTASSQTLIEAMEEHVVELKKNKKIPKLEEFVDIPADVAADSAAGPSSTAGSGSGGGRMTHAKASAAAATAAAAAAAADESDNAVDLISFTVDGVDSRDDAPSPTIESLDPFGPSDPFPTPAGSGSGAGSGAGSSGGDLFTMVAPKSTAPARSAALEGLFSNDDPFATPPQPSRPFGGDNSASDPFGAPTDPFAASSPAHSTASAPTPVVQPFDVFGSGGSGGSGTPGSAKATPTSPGGDLLRSYNDQASDINSLFGPGATATSSPGMVGGGSGGSAMGLTAGGGGGGAVDPWGGSSGGGPVGGGGGGGGGGGSLLDGGGAPPPVSAGPTFTPLIPTNTSNSNGGGSGSGTAAGNGAKASGGLDFSDLYAQMKADKAQQ